MEKKYIAPEADFVRLETENILLKLSGEADDLEKVGNAPEYDFNELFGL